MTETPKRKGLHRYCHVSPLLIYLCAILAIAFFVLGAIELFDIDNLRFIRMGNSFQFSLLFAILCMVSRIYYKLFEEQYDKHS